MTEPSLPEELLFVQAVEIKSAAERAVFLDRACAQNLALRAEVEALLRADGVFGDMLDLPENSAPTTTLPAGESPGTVIGPYKLLEQIGEGGFGVVFMAEQAQPLRRRVALKVLKPGMDSRQIIARFEAERQALALMDHPHIAKVLDAGQTAGGRPYFVMDLVKGLPFTEFCDQARLTLGERLGLFVHVCQAVQHAHQKGIIHRDLKPSNVLVTTQDGAPLVKVIDFGIAKAVGQQLTDKTLFTGFAQFVGTPLYMSPEQTALSNVDVDTRSDVYSLGVMLYELLTGTTPFEKERLQDVGYDELRRIICEEEPPRPSKRISTLGQAATVVSTQRRIDPHKLSQLCHGELDWIVMKALDKDRARRYETASAFAADVQCYLADEPVQACPPRASYRLRKFVQRNKGPVLAAGVILFLLVAGIVGTTTGLVWALAAEGQAVTERDEKEEARRQTRQALNTMTDEVMEELLGRQVQLTDKHRAFLRKVLAYHAAFAAAKGDDPEGRHSRADGYFRVGGIRFTLGEFKDAESAFRAALALQKQLAAEFPNRPEYRRELTATYSRLVFVLSTTRRAKEAEAVSRAELTVRRQLAADFPTRTEFRQELVWSHGELGFLLRNSGRPKEAAKVYRAGLAVAERLAADFPRRTKFREEVADCHYKLAELLDATGRPEEAKRAYQAALTLWKQLPAEHAKQADSDPDWALVNKVQLAVMLAGAGRRKEAEAAYRKALAFARQLVAKFPARPQLRHQLGLCYQNLGFLLGKMGRLREPEGAFRAAVAIYKQLAANFPNRPDYRGGLAMAQASLGNMLIPTDRAKSEAAYREALALLKELAADLPNQTDYRRQLARCYFFLGELLSARGQPKEAEAADQGALTVARQLVAQFPGRPEFRQDLAWYYVHFGDLLHAGAQDPKAEAAYRRALILYQELAAEFPTQPEFSHGVAVTHYCFGNALRSMKGRLEEAIAQFRAAIRLNKDYPEAHTNLGNALCDKGDLEGAIVEFREAIGTKRKFPEACNAHMGLGNALKAKGRRGDAITAYRQAIRLKPEFADAHYALGNVLFPDRLEEAIAEYRAAIRIHKDYAQVHNNLGNALALQGDLAGAIAEYRKAIELKKDLPEAHQNLARALHLLRLNARLPAVQQRKDQPKDAMECLDFAELCLPPYRKHYAGAARFFGKAFVFQPKLAEDLQGWHRYNAACAAALAGCGRGQEAGKLDARERARLRRQALDWLRADLEAWGRLLNKEQSKIRPVVVERMRHWLADPDFAGVRGPQAFAQLPEAERAGWQKLWEDVAGMLARAQAETTPKKKSGAK
jgi:serine/threonine protein kinase/Flp pilus assembly protein TadD